MHNQMSRIIQSRAMVRRSDRGRCALMSVREAHGCCDELSMKLGKRHGLNQGRRDCSGFSIMVRDMRLVSCRIDPCIVDLRLESRLQFWQCIRHRSLALLVSEAGTSTLKIVHLFEALPRTATYLVQLPACKTWQSELSSLTSKNKKMFANPMYLILKWKGVNVGIWRSLGGVVAAFPRVYQALYA